MTNEEAINVLKMVSCENSCVNRVLQEAINLAIKALENKTQWISVKDRLPDDDETVLVYKPLAKGTTIEIQVTQGWCINPSIMSHWMLLPAPPKEET